MAAPPPPPAVDLFAGMDTPISGSVHFDNGNRAGITSNNNNNDNNRDQNGGGNDRCYLPRSRPTRESVLKRLSEALLRRSLTKIDLSQRGLCPSDAKLVKMALLQNANLCVLKLGYNHLGDEGVAMLSAGIATHGNLESLDLGFNQIHDAGLLALADGLRNSSLRTLYLAGNLFGQDGAMAIGDAIRSFTKLETIHLTGNRLGPEGVAAITNAIIEQEMRRNEDATLAPVQGGVRELFLGGTSMGPAGCAAVAKMLEQSATLKVISLANCAIGDEEVGVLASSIKANRMRLPLEALQLSFNEITAKGLDSLINALWESRSLKELLLDNNEIGDRGGHQIANILPHVRTLQVLDIGFNSIKSSGMRTLMKVVAETQNLVSLSVSGNPIDTNAAKSVAYALAYNRSLQSLFLDNCLIEHEGQRHIVAGVISNSGISLRKLTGFRVGPVIVTIGLPPALEHWTNEQVLNFIHLMWEKQSSGEEPDDTKDAERELDPLNFLPDSNGDVGKAIGPLDATTVVEVAKRAFASLGDYGENVFANGRRHKALDSPLAEDAVIMESINGNGAVDTEMLTLGINGIEHGGSSSSNGRFGEGLPPKGPAKSFVATPAEPAVESIVPDPARKKRIVDWLCQNIQHLNELSQLKFNSGELWRLHQHYFTPVVNETGGSVGPSPHQSVDRIVNSVPDVSRGMYAEVSNVTPSTQSSEDVGIPQSDPALGMPQNAAMLKRKTSYHFLGDAEFATPAVRQPEVSIPTPSFNGTVARMLEDAAGAQNAMPPKTKRARRNKTRISFLPRIKAKLDSNLDVCHEKALILMRQLYFVEGALLKGKINPETPMDCPTTHLSGVLASEAEMILVDMM